MLLDISESLSCFKLKKKTVKLGKEICIPRKISKHVLTIGPNYKNHRGGIGAVIEIYSKYFEQFQFLPTQTEGNGLKKMLFLIRFLFKYCFKLLLKREIRIVHIHGGSNVSFYRKFLCFFIAKYIFRKKVVYHIHGGEFHLFFDKSNIASRKLIRFFIEETDLIICLSKKWEKFFTANFKPKSIYILPNIIDFPSRDLSISKTSKIITFLFLGLVCSNKGIFDLLKVISDDLEFYKGKARLIIGGNGDVPKLLEVIKKYNLNEVVSYLGWIKNEEKIRCLQKADIYILPSYNEGLPISILEAMSYGKPIISTDVGGIPEIVIPGRNGILVEPGNLKQLKEAVNCCINNFDTLQEFGKESKLIVEKYFPNSVIKKLMAIYRTI